MSWRCEGCKFWSELVAQTDERGFVEALCLHPDRPRTFTRTGCRDHVDGVALDHIEPIKKRERY